MSSEVTSTLHEVLEKLKIMEKKIDEVLEKVRMHNEDSSRGHLYTQRYRTREIEKTVRT